MRISKDLSLSRLSPPSYSFSELSFAIGLRPAHTRVTEVRGLFSLRAKKRESTGPICNLERAQLFKSLKVRVYARSSTKGEGERRREREGRSPLIFSYIESRSQGFLRGFKALFYLFIELVGVDGLGV